MMRIIEISNNCSISTVLPSPAMLASEVVVLAKSHNVGTVLEWFCKMQIAP